MKKMLTFLFIVLMAPICNAQEEIIFNKQNIDKKDIKVSRHYRDWNLIWILSVFFLVDIWVISSDQ